MNIKLLEDIDIFSDEMRDLYEDAIQEGLKRNTAKAKELAEKGYNSTELYKGMHQSGSDEDEDALIMLDGISRSFDDLIKALGGNRQINSGYIPDFRYLTRLVEKLF